MKFLAVEDQSGLHFYFAGCCQSALHRDLTTQLHCISVRYSSFPASFLGRELTTWSPGWICEKLYLVMVMDSHLPCFEGVKHLPEVGWAIVFSCLWTVSPCFGFMCMHVGKVIFLLIFRYTLCTKSVNPFGCLVNKCFSLVCCLTFDCVHVFLLGRNFGCG